MNFFRQNKNWLRYRTNSLIREKHKNLFLPTWKYGIRTIKEYLIDSSRWWLILIIVITIFVVGGLINISFLNFIKLTTKTANILVDQRTGNIAAITALTLVVVGFLINNLAVKEAFAYRILFKHSYLFPIIYLTLSTIGCFFLISTFRDELVPLNFKNMVLTGTYLSLIILFLIGYLFKRIIQFTNDKIIKKLLHTELMIEETRNLRKILVENYSNKLYTEEMTRCGAYEYNWEEFVDYTKLNLGFKKKTDEDIVELEAKERYIYDINLISLKRFILEKKEHNKIFYQNLYLEKVITEYDNYLLQIGKINSNIEKAKLRKSLKIKRKKKTESDLVRKYFDHKLEELTNKSEYRELENLLDSYYKMYDLQMNHLHIYEDLY